MAVVVAVVVVSDGGGVVVAVVVVSDGSCNCCKFSPFFPFLTPCSTWQVDLPAFCTKGTGDRGGGIW